MRLELLYHSPSSFPTYLAGSKFVLSRGKGGPCMLPRVLVRGLEIHSNAARNLIRAPADSVLPEIIKNKNR